MDRLLSPSEAQQMLGGVSRNYLTALRESGLLRFLKIGKGYCLRQKTLEEFLEKYDGQNINKLIDERRCQK